MAEKANEFANGAMTLIKVAVCYMADFNYPNILAALAVRAISVLTTDSDDFLCGGEQQ
jgi:hypothetical protein